MCELRGEPCPVSGPPSKSPGYRAVLVGSVHLLSCVLAVSPEGRRMRNVLVNAGLGRNDRVHRVALFHESKRRSVQAPVVACVKNIVAEVRGVRGDIVEIQVGRVASKQAFSRIEVSLEDQTCVVKNSRVTLGDMASRSKHPDADAVSYPERFLEVVLPVRRSRLRAAVHKVVPVRVELVPLLLGNARVVIATVIGAVDEPFNGERLAAQKLEPGVMVMMLMCNENTA